MGSQAVAVINVRSAQITAMVAEKGVNETFVFKGVAESAYDGFTNGLFSDEEAFVHAVASTLEKAIFNCGAKVSAVYVGVPTEFLTLYTRDNFVGFSSKRKIGYLETEEFFEKNFPPDLYPDKTLIRTACSYYVLSDKRRVLNPEGFLSSSLSGRASYIFCSNYFMRHAEAGVRAMGNYKISFIPSVYAQAMYLIPSEVRSSGAALIDFGVCSTEVAIVNGNSVVAMASLPVGEANIMYELAHRYNLHSYGLLSELVSRSNLYIKDASQCVPMEDFPSDIKYVDVSEVINRTLGPLSEWLDNFLQANEDKFSGGVHGVYATGEGILGIRGAIEKITYLLSVVIEVAAPDLPYYDKPGDSSALSLAFYAYGDSGKQKNKNSLLYKFLKKFGG